MSQDEILNALEEADLTRKELQKRLHISQVAISIALKQLLKYSEIIIKEYKENTPIYSVKK